MTVIEAIILGLVQGLTEFLPVSSSGHLIMAQKLLGVEGDLLFFDIMLHIGTLVAVFVVFYKDILGLLKPPFKSLGLLVLATIPAVIVMLLFKDHVETLFGGKFLFLGFLLTAGILMATEWYGRRAKSDKDITIYTALAMGAAQAIAVIPGISRSGSTISGGVFSGVQRNKVAKFSFLMSIPVILGSGLVSVLDVTVGGAGMGGIGVGAIIAGMLASAISGYFAVRFMLKIIQKCNYKWFSLYLAAAGVAAFFMFFL